MAWRYLQQMSAIRQLFTDFLISIFILLVIKASSGSIVLIVFLLSEYRLKFVLAGIIAAIAVFPLLLNLDNRAIGIMIQIFSHSSIEEMLKYILSVSGIRLISIIAAYNYCLSHPFGGGIGLWQKSSMDSLYQTGINPSDIAYFNYNSGGSFSTVRPNSYLSSTALDMGWIGISVIFYLIKPLFKLLSPENKIFSLTCTFLFYLIVFGTVGNPIPWICMALCYRVYKNNLTQLQS
jgi:hypothetical protein